MLHSTPKSTSHLYVRFRSTKYISSQFAEKRPGKNTDLYDLNITLKTYVCKYLPAEILENQDVPIFGGLKVKNQDCPDKIRTVNIGRYETVPLIS